MIKDHTGLICGDIYTFTLQNVVLYSKICCFPSYFYFLQNIARVSCQLIRKIDGIF